MKTCYYCHSPIPEEASICPKCGSDLTQVPQGSSPKGPAVFDKHSDTSIITLRPVQKESAVHQEKPVPEAAVRFTEKARDYLRFLTQKIADPSESRVKNKRTRMYGYVTFALQALFTAIALVRLAVGLENQYEWLSSISILPTLTFEIKLLEWLSKSFLICLFYFLTYPFLCYAIKKLVLKRQHRLAAWMTEFAGMNVLALLFATFALLMSFVAPLLLGVPVIVLLFLGMVSYQTSFIASLYSTSNESRVPTLYLVLAGVGLHFISVLALLYLLLKF